MRAVLPFLVTLCAAQPAFSNESLPATRIAQMFFTQCLDPLASDVPPDTSNLVQFSQEEAEKHHLTSNGRVWSARDADVLLTWRHNKSGEFEGCIVQPGTIVSKGGSIDAENVASAFDQWADKEIKRGRYFEFTRCWNTSTNYIRVLENTFPRKLPIRAFVSWEKNSGSIFLVAAEAKEGGDARPCKQLPPAE
ncbi:MAG: hypothetical protein HWE35_15665 [Rhodobacteraceae bacterium]|nr:hypothetical protein [Paracoccaceae bacterium]